MSDVEEVVIQEAEAPVETPAPETPAAVAVAPETPVAPAEPIPEEVGGLKAALIAERTERKTLRDKAQTLEQQVQQAQQQIAQFGPYVAFMQANPHLFDPSQKKPEPVAAPADAPPDPRLVKIAQTLDLWTPQGQPDLKRAAEARDMFREDARETAQQLVQPFQQRSLQDQSSLNYRQALDTVDANGQKPDPNALAAVFQRMGPQMTSTPDGAALAVLVARGLQTMSQKAAPAPLTTMPVFTEASGGGSQVKTALTALEERIAKERGHTATQWAEITKTYKSGQPTVMEE